MFDSDQFHANLERALRATVPHEPTPPTLEERVSVAVFNAGHFVGYCLIWLPAHLIHGVWAGVCSAWERAGE